MFNTNITADHELIGSYVNSDAVMSDVPSAIVIPVGVVWLAGQQLISKGAAQEVLDVIFGKDMMSVDDVLGVGRGEVVDQFDPSIHSINEVLEHAKDEPGDIERVIHEERLGKNRPEIVEHLSPPVQPATGGGETYQPNEHKVEDVVAYMEGHPDERDAILKAESGPGGLIRKGILEHKFSDAPSSDVVDVNIVNDGSNDKS